MKIRFLSFILALLLLCAPLCACNTPANEPEATTPADTTKDPAITTEDPDVTPPDNTEPSDLIAPITPENANGLYIICKENASSVIKNSLKQLAQSIARKFGCNEPTVINGDAPERDGVLEIVVGSPLEGALPLRENDSVIGFESEDIYINAGSLESLYLAIGQFSELVQNGTKISTEDPLYIFGNYPIRSLSINGVHISEYTVVIPKNANMYEKYAAELFCEFIAENVGFSINTVKDTAEEAKYEILVGETARTPQTAAKLGDGQYAVFSSGDKIVCLGKNHMVAAGLALITENSPANGEEHKLNVSADTAARTFEYKAPDSAILMIGDGMGYGSIEMAKQNKVISKFSAADMPVHGQSKTNNVSNSTTDSAAGATALSTGEKTANGYLGVDKNGTAIVNVREFADIMGAKTAVLTTDSITGATPAGFLAHHKSRSDTSILKTQIDTLIANKKIEFCEGSVGDNLLVRFKLALKTVSEGNSDFFIMLEEAYIDKESHNNNLVGTCTSVRRFDVSIAYAMVFTVYHSDTVLIVTADHETGGIKENTSGKYAYTSTGHTSANVPIFACGAGTERFHDKAVENTDIPKFIASIFGAKSFGK